MGQAAPGRRSFTFRDMCLEIGDRLQIECPASVAADRVFVRVIGYVEPLSLLVTAPMHRGKRLNLVEHDTVVIRAFSRQSAFAFRASVLRVCKLPFEYLHLSFPQAVQGAVIRKSSRVRTQMAVDLSNISEGGLERHTASIENISSTGALIVSDKALGSKGEMLRLNFQARVHDVDMPLELESEIMSELPQDEIGATSPERKYRCGVEFRNLRPSDLMVIKGLVYQQIIENPHSAI